MIIKHGTIHDAIHETPYVGDIKVEHGKITSIAEAIEALDGEKVIDATGMQVYPGFVDAHSHLGLDPYGIGLGDKDYNETTEPLTPQLRGIDSFNPQDSAVEMALHGGVTTVGTGPGSSNILGGTFFAVKTVGRCVDNMVVRDPVAMKAAFGQNPKKVYEKKGCSVRMTVAAKLRDMLFQTKEYLAKKEAAGGIASKMPKFDMKLESLIPVIKRELPLKIHAHRADDICTAIRIAKEFNLRITLEHVTDGHLIAGEIAAAGYPVAVGPSFGTATKPELKNRSFETVGILDQAGCQVSIITDAPAIPQEYLPLMAGLCVRAGMDPFHALQAVTINPARHLGIEDRVGSLEIGKDADIVLANGNMLLSSTRVRVVLVDGVVVYE